ncbi:MAG: UPF0149 family protein [Gammaproteobacteria bacterium]|nr:UPF0149 family protein [Gammaproteobacteria bacterium]MDH5628868.1 UPF0149 family protein [Gammaproteobacteria bacterium]
MNFDDEMSYESVEESLAESGCEVSAAELQGILCGILASGIMHKTDDWMEEVLAIASDQEEPPSDLKNLVELLYDWSEARLSQQESLAPTLLPDDSYPVIDQIEAIADWSQGFLMGFGLYCTEKLIEKDDIREALSDISEISQLAIDEDETEEAQHALLTVIEHVKVSVQIIHWEMVVQANVENGQSAMEGNDTLH